MYTIAGVYNITGKNDDQVVKILNTIVNGEDYKTNGVFNFMIIPASSNLQNLQAFQRKPNKKSAWQWRTLPTFARMVT